MHKKSDRFMLFSFKKALVFLLSCSMHLQAVKSSSCINEHEFLDEDGTCKICNTCSPGFEPTPHLCGYGKKDPQYSCKPCDRGTFSRYNDYNLCRTCSPCKRWHAAVYSSCTSTADAVCGDCMPEYFRPKKADGNMDVECHKCNESTHVDCATTEWKTTVIIVLGIVVTISLIFSVVFGCLWRRSSQNAEPYNTEIKLARETNHDLLEIISCDGDTVTTSVLEPLTDTQHNQKPAPKEAKEVFLHSNSLTYSQLPTAEFCQHNTYSHLPTAVFQTHLSNDDKRQLRLHEFQGTKYNIPRMSSRSDMDLFRGDVGSFDTDSISNPVPRNGINSLLQV